MPGGDLSSIDLDEELGNTAFFGHWKMCDFLLMQGADARLCQCGYRRKPRSTVPSARQVVPHYNYVVRLLLEHGADTNAATVPGPRNRRVHARCEKRAVKPRCTARPRSQTRGVSSCCSIMEPTRKCATPMAIRRWPGRAGILRPGAVLSLAGLWGSTGSRRPMWRENTSDHGAGWGNAMERSLLGDYLPESL